MMPFAGKYRLVDFPLSNCINSGLRRIFVLTQHNPLSLHHHIRHAWAILSTEISEFVEILPPMRRLRNTWYLGTADAIYQNIASILEEHPSEVLILSADHVYKMDYRRMIEWHRRKNAEVTIATIRVPLEEAGRFGLALLDENHQVTGFEEKPKPGSVECDSGVCNASMGVYLFSTATLIRALTEDAAVENSSHDFGKDILPRLFVQGARTVPYDFAGENTESLYWEDVGTIDSYYAANMEFLGRTPPFDLYGEWPIRRATSDRPPARFISGQEGMSGVAFDSLVSDGCVVNGGIVESSILGVGCTIGPKSSVRHSILFEDVSVGSHSHLHRAIVDRSAVMPDRMSIGFDANEDRRRGFVVTASGITVVPAQYGHRALDELGILDPHTAESLKVLNGVFSIP
jgi:glucose-1-phosphate adenylyltransferase